MSTYTELPVPSFYNPANSRSWAYRPDQLMLTDFAEEWAKKHNLKPAASQKFNLHLLIIDAQKDFCFPPDQGGALYVSGRSGTGAMDDNDRLAQFIYRNLGLVKDITTTLDTHFAFQIFFAPFWINQKGERLKPHSLIMLLRDGGRERLANIALDGTTVLHDNIRPHPGMAAWLTGGNYPWLESQVKFYVSELARKKKYTLYLWPPHCLLGSEGHALAGVIHEARMFHALTRIAQSYCEVKGGNELTENYSVLSPEVLGRWDGQGNLAERNTDFIKKLLVADATVIAGQADSHCVKSSIADLLEDILKADPALAKKVYVMTDCMSSVVVPDGKGGIAVDFTPQAEEAHQKFADAKMNLVKSTDPIESWPGIRL